MLIEFSVTNFRSFKDTQTLSMAASRYFHEMEVENSFETGIKGLPRFLRSAAIYGPNASGKSNLIAALATMRSIVLSSAKETQEGEQLAVTPFILDSESRGKETKFEVIFIEERNRYQYGFSLNRERVLEEWLIAYPEGRRPQRWFNRTYDSSSKEYAYEFGTRFLGGRLRQEWKKATRGNALFLSVAVQFNSEQLKPVFLWFQKRLRIVSESSGVDPDTPTICKTGDGKKNVLDFLNNADLSIVDIQIETKKFSPDNLDKDMPTELKKYFRKKLEGKDFYKIRFIHKDNKTGEPIPLDISEESSGTANLFSFASPWLDAIGNDKVLVVDEIDTSLHPLIVHQLIRLLHSSVSKAQLIFTTHDTTILSRDIMRRDQVWFIEKDKANSSRLYPLSDFKVRGKEAIERGYLMGRYGAIPYIRDFIVHG